MVNKYVVSVFCQKCFGLVKLGFVKRENIFWGGFKSLKSSKLNPYEALNIYIYHNT